MLKSWFLKSGLIDDLTVLNIFNSVVAYFIGQNS